MKQKLKRIAKAEGRYGTGEWEVSPWWSSFFPFIYKSKSYYFPLQRHEFPITPYRTRKNGKMVVSPSMRTEYWNGWLVKIARAIGSLVDRATAKIKAIRKPDMEDIPF